MVAFIGASALFILLEIDFLALILLIVYVGAIAILFLFVIMMLTEFNWLRGNGSVQLFAHWVHNWGSFLSEVLILQTRISMGVSSN